MNSTQSADLSSNPTQSADLSSTVIRTKLLLQALIILTLFQIYLVHIVQTRAPHYLNVSDGV